MEIPHVILICMVICIGILLAWRITMRREGRYAGGYDTGMSMTIGDRELQEDCYAVEPGSEGVLAVLADGMGRQFGGKIAARIAVETFQKLFHSYNSFDNPNYYFNKAFFAANRNILNAVEESRGAASAAAAMVQGDKLYYATVGNVKIAIFRDGDLIPVTAGHTIDRLAQERYNQGRLTREDAISLLEEHRLYNYVGQDSFQEIEYFDEPVRLKKGDYIMLMSDGVYETLSWKQLEECLAGKGSCQEKAYAMVELINQSELPEKDNGSVVILERKI